MRLRACVIAALLAAAAPAFAQGGEAAAKRPLNSGFLGDYSKLKPAPDREGVVSYVDPSAKIGGYNKILLRPAEVYISPSTSYKGVQPDALKRMTDTFLGSFRKALTPGYEIVTAPGPDVLEVRTAISGIQPVSAPMTPLDVLPAKVVFNLGRAAAGKAPQVVEMQAEMEVLDPSGKRVAAAVANRKGDKTLTQGDQITWDHLQAISDYWARNFRQRLDELRKAPQ
ncbi:MAG TPA: DUF3313 domain-containing protein [Burkholderiales bacterium]|nr:DUF3313 domain-containing protein [Burkholderiales bacterium]